MYSNPNKKWACVQWKDEINFSVVSMSDFHKIKDDEEYEENSFYKVKFGNSKYNARLVCMGKNIFIQNFIRLLKYLKIKKFQVLKIFVRKLKLNVYQQLIAS